MGQLASLGRPNGVTTTQNYDGSGRLLTLRHTGPSGLLEETNYSYNAVGMAQTMQRGGHLATYGYDALDQLTSAAQGHPDLPDEWYQYDAVGNRTSSHLSASSSYDAANQLLEDAQWTYSYDASGRLIEKQDKATHDRWTYGYDYEDRLTAVRRYAGGTVPSSPEVSYAYDGLGRRIARTVDGVRTVWVYDGHNFIRAYDGNRALLQRHVNGLGVDEPLAGSSAGEQWWHLADRLGSVTGLTDANGNATGEYLYDSFGRVLEAPANAPDGYGFTGREWEAETGSYYCRRGSMIPD